MMITPQMLRDWGCLELSWRVPPDGLPAGELAAITGVAGPEMLRALLRAEVLPEATVRRLAAAWASKALALISDDNPGYWGVLASAWRAADVAERYAAGRATAGEMASASRAAQADAWDVQQHGGDDGVLNAIMAAVDASSSAADLAAVSAADRAAKVAAEIAAGVATGDALASQLADIRAAMEAHP